MENIKILKRQEELLNTIEALANRKVEDNQKRFFLNLKLLKKIVRAVSI